MENIRLIIKDYHYGAVGIGNVLKCLISSLSINDDTVIQCHPDYMYGKYDTILDDRFIYKGQTDKELEKVYTARMLILAEEENLQQDFLNEEGWMAGLQNPRFDKYFSFSKRIDTCYYPDYIHPVIKERIFKIIDKIIFKPIIYEKVNTIYESFKDNTTLGISIRTWTAIHESDIDRKYNTETYQEKIKEVLAENKDINKLIISIDNIHFLSQYLPFLYNLKIPFKILTKDKDINDIQYALIKVLTLGKCNYCIGNRISSFTELIFWFSKMKVKMYSIF